LSEYIVSAQNVADHPDLRTALGVSENGGCEDIRRGEQLEYCDSPLGRIATAICVGFFHFQHQDLLRACEADIHLVPAMTPDCRDLHNAAWDLVRSHHASTFVANCGTVGVQAPSFYRLPLAGEEAVEIESGKDLLVFDLSIM
jgi:predicted amidohydrolase